VVSRVSLDFSQECERSYLN